MASFIEQRIACETHKQDPVVGICKNCAELVCGKCMLEAHKGAGHHCVNIDDEEALAIMKAKTVAAIDDLISTNPSDGITTLQTNLGCISEQLQTLNQCVMTFNKALGQFCTRLPPCYDSESFAFRLKEFETLPRVSHCANLQALRKNVEEMNLKSTDTTTKEEVAQLNSGINLVETHVHSISRMFLDLSLKIGADRTGLEPEEMADKIAEETRMGTSGYLTVIPTCPEMHVSFTSIDGVDTFGPFRTQARGKINMEILKPMLLQSGALVQRLTALLPAGAAELTNLIFDVKVQQPLGRFVHSSRIELPVITDTSSRNFSAVLDTKLVVFAPTFSKNDTSQANMEVYVDQSGQLTNPVDGFSMDALVMSTNENGSIYLAAPPGLVLDVRPADSSFSPIRLPMVSHQTVAVTPWAPMLLPYHSGGGVMSLNSIKVRSGAAILGDISGSMSSGKRMQQMAGGMKDMCSALASKGIPHMIGKWNTSIEVFKSPVTNDTLSSALQWIGSMTPGGGNDMRNAIVTVLSGTAKSMGLEISDVHVICDGDVKPFHAKADYPAFDPKSSGACGWGSFRKAFPHVNFHFHALAAGSDHDSMMHMAMVGGGSSSKFT